MDQLGRDSGSRITTTVKENGVYEGSAVGVRRCRCDLGRPLTLGRSEMDTGLPDVTRSVTYPWEEWDETGVVGLSPTRGYPWRRKENSRLHLGYCPVRRFTCRRSDQKLGRQNRWNSLSTMFISCFWSFDRIRNKFPHPVLSFETYSLSRRTVFRWKMRN